MKKNKNTAMKWFLAILLLIMSSLIIGILSVFFPDITMIFGVPFALLYFISGIVLLIVYEVVLKPKN